MKKTFISLLTLCLLFSLSSCNLKNLFSEEVYEKDIADIKSQEIRDCTVVYPSEENLKALFCNKVRKTSSFDYKIKSLFTFLNQYEKAIGDKETVKEIDNALLESKDNGTKYVYLTAYTYHSTFDENDVLKKSWYYFTYYNQIKSDDEDLIGLNYLCFQLLNTKETIQIGDFN